jgi:hypothetical protein
MNWTERGIHILDSDAGKSDKQNVLWENLAQSLLVPR